jgi:hypothetical protein
MSFTTLPIIPSLRRGTCPECGSPNLHAKMTLPQLREELQRPTLMVLCQQCPNVFVLPIWGVPLEHQTYVPTFSTVYVVDEHYDKAAIGLE